MSESAMSKDDLQKSEQPSLWQRHRIPIVLGIIAVGLYLGSIVWMVFTGSQGG